MQYITTSHVTELEQELGDFRGQFIVEMVQDDDGKRSICMSPSWGGKRIAFVLRRPGAWLLAKGFKKDGNPKTVATYPSLAEVAASLSRGPEPATV